jgi:hypothetical protein
VQYEAEHPYEAGNTREQAVVWPKATERTIHRGIKANAQQIRREALVWPQGDLRRTINKRHKTQKTSPAKHIPLEAQA